MVMRLNKIQILSLILAVIVLANFFLMVFRVISLGLFWVVIVLVAIFAYWVMPKLKARKL